MRAAATELLARSATVLVSPQLDGVEVAVGAVRDPDFGPVVMVGSGGIWVEALGDTAFALAPLTLAEAHEVIATLRVSAVLRGARGQEPADLDALARLLVAAGDALVGLPHVGSIDLNPVLVSPRSAVAVDWSLHPRRGPGASGPVTT